MPEHIHIWRCDECDTLARDEGEVGWIMPSRTQAIVKGMSLFGGNSSPEEIKNAIELLDFIYGPTPPPSDQVSKEMD